MLTILLLCFDQIEYIQKIPNKFTFKIQGRDANYTIDVITCLIDRNSDFYFIIV